MRFLEDIAMPKCESRFGYVALFDTHATCYSIRGEIGIVSDFSNMVYGQMRERKKNGGATRRTHSIRRVLHPSGPYHLHWSSVHAIVDAIV